MLFDKNYKNFIVKELIDLDKENGPYLYVKLIKKDWNTIDAVNEIAKRLRIEHQKIGFAGLKDRNALTEQYISIYKINKEEIKRLKIKDIELEPLHYGSKPIRLGDLKGNYFKITLDTKPIKINQIENYFGEQRFSKNNYEIGLSILRKDFPRAVSLLDNNQVNQYLSENKTDYVGALKKIDKRLFSLLVDSVRSKLWNEVVKEFLKSQKGYVEFEDLIFLKKKIKNKKIPLFSYGVDFQDKKIEEIYKKILGRYNLKDEDFLIRTFPEIIPTEGERDLVIDVKKFKISKNTMEFMLPKGSYATILIKKVESFLSIK